MDETDIRLSELEDRVEELEKLCGMLTAQMKKSEAAMLALSEQADSVAHELAELKQSTEQLGARTGQLEQTVSALDDDINDTIEDFNILSDEMHRRWHKLLARQEQQRWDDPRRRTRHEAEDRYDEDDGDDTAEDDFAEDDEDD